MLHDLTNIKTSVHTCITRGVGRVPPPHSYDIAHSYPLPYLDF